MNLVEKAVKNGGKLVPLTISKGLTNGTGLMNPAVFVDDNNLVYCIDRYSGLDILEFNA